MGHGAVVFGPCVEVLADRAGGGLPSDVGRGLFDRGFAGLRDGVEQAGHSRWIAHRTIVSPFPTVTVGRALLAAVLLVLTGCGTTTSPSAAPATPVLHPQVLAEVPHDTTAFTEGFEIDGGVLYEGTGLEGRSQLRELDPATGAVERSVPLPGRLFGEGIAVVGDRIWQLTWRDGVVLEWDRATLTLRRQVPLDGEGWGLCSDGGGPPEGHGGGPPDGHGGGPPDGHGGRLVRSDGTDRLRFQDPGTFAEEGSVAVTLDGAPVTEINELECVGGQVWANIWRSDRIVRIDPASGHVTAVVDAAGLLDPARRASADVLNGIAAVPGTDEFLITGKFWPVAFRVRFVP
jgi:glutamine cyclotransferase